MPQQGASAPLVQVTLTLQDLYGSQQCINLLPFLTQRHIIKLLALNLEPYKRHFLFNSRLKTKVCYVFCVTESIVTYLHNLEPYELRLGSQVAVAHIYMLPVDIMLTELQNSPS